LPSGWRRRAHDAGDLGGALAALDRALQIEPQHANLWVSRAGMLQTLGRDAKAQDAIARALELAPAEPNAVVLAANLAIARGDDARAETFLRGLFAARPFEIAARANLASTLERSNRFAEAEREARAGLKLAAHARGRGRISTPSYSQVSQGLYTSARASSHLDASKAVYQAIRRTRHCRRCRVRLRSSSPWISRARSSPFASSPPCIRSSALITPMRSNDSAISLHAALMARMLHA
jgi:tetratricopeptide (TPR) repeat protein